MDEDNTLFMLCDPKKCKTRKQINMDTYLNNYNKHQNELLSINNNEDLNNETSNDTNSETNSETNLNNENINNEKEELPQCMIEVVNHINKIDEFILNNNYDKNMEKINDYLIDLLFLIKSKKK